MIRQSATGSVLSEPNEVVKIVLQQQPQDVTESPFVRWHLQKKFEVMEKLFRKYLGPNAKLADVGCGSCDALVLASMCSRGCETWGLDMDRGSLDIGQRRLPEARLHQGDMHNPIALPKNYFDVVHEFGAAFHAHGWDELARVYLSLLKDDGVLLWELPQRWSCAHISYLLNLAPKASPTESKGSRLLRSFSPSKYRFESDNNVRRALRDSGYGYEVIESVPIWYFFRPKMLAGILDWAWKYQGDRMFDWLDKLTRFVLPRAAGYYLVVRKRDSSDACDDRFTLSFSR